ncbi:hypothetical protein [Pedobacter glucosidilyticus]|uniref:hypothetical protein n=1 Tax=Pedobacter glucosidilyticus TaxID=1122941 RepID=UPI0026F02A57|nr:hypothetical protein [Pedobacter glucosidilyticus]
MLRYFKNKFQSLIRKVLKEELNLLTNRLDNLKDDSFKILTSKLLLEEIKKKNINTIKDAEFKVFSQWGDDGIIQYLINNINIEKEIFIEFGVQDYTESNTRYLLMNNNWTGLIMDGSKSHIDFVKRDNIYWQYDLKAIQEFVTAENINMILEREGFTGEIGLYHIDIDGNDYWIWKATEVISPVIVIVEYQSLFGFERAITTPYRANFVRTKEHHSDLYYGASILALCDLAEDKGYHFIGCNSSGNNAYFVRKDKIGNLSVLSASEGYVNSKFKESKNPEGRLTYISGDSRLEVIKGMDVYNTRSQTIEKI